MAVSCVLNQGRIQRKRIHEIQLCNFARRFFIGTLNADLHIQATRPKDGGIDHFLTVGGANNNDIAQVLNPVDFRQKLWDDGIFQVRGNTRATSPKDRVHFIEEHDDRPPVLSNRSSTVENLPNLPLRFAHKLIEQLRALNVQEVALSPTSHFFPLTNGPQPWQSAFFRSQVGHKAKHPSAAGDQTSDTSQDE